MSEKKSNTQMKRDIYVSIKNQITHKVGTLVSDSKHENNKSNNFPYSYTNTGKITPLVTVTSHVKWAFDKEDFCFLSSCGFTLQTQSRIVNDLSSTDMVRTLIGKYQPICGK